MKQADEQADFCVCEIGCSSSAPPPLATPRAGGFEDTRRSYHLITLAASHMAMSRLGVHVMPLPICYTCLSQSYSCYFVSATVRSVVQALLVPGDIPSASCSRRCACC